MKPNVELAYQVLDIIKNNPEHWNQRDWHCDTSHCFAGFVDCIVRNINWKTSDAMCGFETVESVFNLIESMGVNPTTIKSLRTLTRQFDIKKELYYSCYTQGVAQAALGINENQADALFDAYNTLEDLEDLVLKIFGPRPVRAKVKQVESVPVSVSC